MELYFVKKKLWTLNFVNKLKLTFCCRKLFQRTLTASAPGSTDSEAEEEVRENMIPKNIK